MNNRMKIVLGVCAAAAVLIAALVVLADFSAPKLVLVDGYEAPYGTEISVYDLVESVQDKSKVELTLSGDGEVVSDGKAILFSTAGMHTVEIIAEDIHGNQCREPVQITVVDATPPTIQAKPVTVCKGETPDYTAAVTATDDVDGDLSASVIVDDSKVDLETAGTYQVTYKVVDQSGNEAVCTGQVTVTRSQAEGLTLNHDTLSLDGNGYAQLKAAVKPEDWEGTVDWSSSDEKVATVSDGLVYWQGYGTCTITARADEFEASCEVTCGGVSPTSVSLNQDTLTLKEGESVTLSCSVLPSNWSGSIRWVSSDSSVASVADGAVTWQGNGTCYITAYAADQIYASCQVTCTGGFTIGDWIDGLIGGDEDDEDEKQDERPEKHHNREKAQD